MTSEEYLRSKDVSDNIADVPVLAGILTTLSDNDIEYEVFNFEGRISVSVRGFGNINGNRLPLHIERHYGNYDPDKTQTDEFVSLVENITSSMKFGSIHYEHIQDPDSDYDGAQGATSLLNDLASLQNGGKFSTFVETTIVYVTEIETPVFGQSLIDLLNNREKEAPRFIERLKPYEFED